jgi:predicted ribosomally synthesized peptide with SipW-like signal peptide
MMKKPIATVFFTFTAMTLLIGGSFAYFSDVRTSTGNTFTGGNMILYLAGGTQNGNSVIGTWVSPSNWAPGDSFTSTLQCTNLGSVGAQHLWFMFYNLYDPSGFMGQIIVTNIQERFNTVTTGNQAHTIATQVGDHADPLTLAEFVGWMTNSYGYYTVDDQSSPCDNLVVAGGNHWDYDLILTFQFAPASTLQGATCSFDMQIQATQMSDTGSAICLHA